MNTSYRCARIGKAVGFHTMNKKLFLRKSKLPEDVTTSGKTRNYYYQDGFLDERIEEIKTGDSRGSSDVNHNGVDSKYIRRHDIRVGSRAQKYFRMSEHASLFWDAYGVQLSDKRIQKLRPDKAVIVKGCFDTNKVTLQRTMIPECSQGNEYPRYYHDLPKRMKKAIKVTIRKLQIPDLEPCVISSMYGARHNLTTKPGFRYTEYLGFATKYDAQDVAYKMATKRWNYIEKCARNGEPLDRSKLMPSTYTIGARNKRDLTYDEGELASSRAVHMPEWHCEINSSPWVDAISEYFTTIGRGPIYIGNNIKKFSRLEDDIANSYRVIEGDWKRFDSTLFIERITIGSAIERLYFKKDSRRTDYHFIAKYDCVAIKDYYLPGGYIYRLYHGLPSGVKETSLLGSIICLFVLVYCVVHLDTKRIKFIVGGDDHLIVFQYNMGEVRPALRAHAEEVGMMFKFLKYKLPLIGNHITSYPFFYKYTVWKGKPIVDPVTAVERMLIPWNRKYKTSGGIADFLLSIIPSLGHPHTGLLPFYVYFCYTLNIFARNTLAVRTALLWHSLAYETMMSKPESDLVTDSIRRTTLMCMLNRNVRKREILGLWSENQLYYLFR